MSWDVFFVLVGRWLKTAKFITCRNVGTTAPVVRILTLAEEQRNRVWSSGKSYWFLRIPQHPVWSEAHTAIVAPNTGLCRLYISKQPCSNIALSHTPVFFVYNAHTFRLRSVFWNRVVLENGTEASEVYCAPIFMVQVIPIFDSYLPQ